MLTPTGESAGIGNRRPHAATFYLQVPKAFVSTRPGGPIHRVGGDVQYLFKGESVTVYARKGHWVRYTDLEHEPRWIDGRLISSKKVPDDPPYAGPKEYQDNRIAEHAIPRPGQENLTKANVDVLWKGAKMVLRTHLECSSITNADYTPDIHDGSPPYYVTCQVNGIPTNVFFTRQEASERHKIAPV